MGPKVGCEVHQPVTELQSSPSSFLLTISAAPAVLTRCPPQTHLRSESRWQVECWHSWEWRLEVRRHPLGQVTNLFALSFLICKMGIVFTTSWSRLEDWRRCWLWKTVKTSLVVQWLRFHASTAKSMGLIPGRGSKILQTHGAASKKKEKKIHGVARISS